MPVSWPTTRRVTSISPRSAIDGDFCDPSGKGGRMARPGAMHVLRLSDAAPADDLSAVGVGSRTCTMFPRRAFRSRARQIRRARITDVTEAKLQRVRICFARKLVDEAFVREYIWQGRNPSQPRGANDRLHVMDGDAEILVIVLRPRRAVSFVPHGRNGLDPTREQ